MRLRGACAPPPPPPLACPTSALVVVPTARCAPRQHQCPFRHPATPPHTTDESHTCSLGWWRGRKPDPEPQTRPQTTTGAAEAPVRFRGLCLVVKPVPLPNAEARPRLRTCALCRLCTRHECGVSAAYAHGRAACAVRAGTAHAAGSIAAWPPTRGEAAAVVSSHSW